MDELKKQWSELTIRYRRLALLQVEENLKEAGFFDVDVRPINENTRGRIKIESGYRHVFDLSFKFFPYKKDGTLSQQPKGRYFITTGCSDAEMIKQLQNKFVIYEG